MQGFNMGRYRAPDSDPRHESFNHGRHPLGKRARHLSSGILIVRFELPFHIWCLTCNAHIPQGRRFNAEKQQVGHYLTTPIWSFTCKCHNCSSRFDIRTDPQNAQYIVSHGARKQIQHWDPAQNGGHPIYDSQASKPTEPTDAFSKLESLDKEKHKAKARKLRLDQLEAHSKRTWSDPYKLNCTLRSWFRKEKRKSIQQLEHDLELKNTIGWHHDQLLLPPSSTLSPNQQQRERKEWTTQQQTLHATRSISANTAKNLTPLQRLQAQLLDKSKSKRDPFLQPR